MQEAEEPKGMLQGNPPLCLWLVAFPEMINNVANQIKQKNLP
jgi:hypothetical protein